MARFIFPADRRAYQYVGPGEPVTVPYPTLIHVFEDEACTVPATIYDLDGDPLAQIYSQDNGLLPEFLCDDLTRLWGKADSVGAEPYPLDANYNSRIDDIIAKGVEGKSAYEVWLDEGNTGTEEDFFDSLSGPPGADSTVPGPPGPGVPVGGSTGQVLTKKSAADYDTRWEPPKLVTYPTGSEPSLVGVPDGTLWVEYTP